MQPIMAVLKHRKRLWLTGLVLFYGALFVLAWQVAGLPVSPFIYDLF